MSGIINELRTAVTERLQAAFEGYAIYEEEPTGGAYTEPCLIVDLLQSEQQPEPGRRYLRSHFFRIEHRDQQATLTQLHGIAEQLYAHMAHIELEDHRVRGLKMRYELVDRILYFFVRYDMMLMQDPPTDPLIQQVTHHIQEAESVAD